jgi:hypothetical protein
VTADDWNFESAVTDRRYSSDFPKTKKPSNSAKTVNEGLQRILPRTHEAGLVSSFSLAEKLATSADRHCADPAFAA